MALTPDEFHDPTLGNDYTLNTMGMAQDLGWRRDTPPGGEDGSVPSVSLTVTDSSVGEGGKQQYNPYYNSPGSGPNIG